MESNLSFKHNLFDRHPGTMWSALSGMYNFKTYQIVFTCFLTVIFLGCNEMPGSSASNAEEPDFFSEIPFSDITNRAGLASFHHNNGSFGEKWFPEIMGSGGGFLDFDGDYWTDIMLVGGGNLPSRTVDSSIALKLYRNEGDGSYADVTSQTGLDGHRSYGMGSIAADYDNDGDADIFLANLGKNFLFRNDEGKYTEVGSQSGVAGDDLWSSSAIFFDADNDGLLDLYVANYVDWSPESNVECRHEGRRDYCNPLHYGPVHDEFYLNNGDGTFTEMTQAAGFLGESVVLEGKGLGVMALDYNRDGWMDIYVANDGDRNFMFANNGDGTFSEVAERSGVAFDRHGSPRAGMGVNAGIMDSTGETTIFVGNFSQETVSVWRHQQGGFFIDRAAVSGIGFSTRQTLTFGLELFDVDLDSDLDVLLANGNVIEQIATMQDGVTFRERPQLFLNRGNGIFDEFVAESGPMTQELLARGLVSGDIDRDGDLDVLITENNGSAHLWQNNYIGKAYLRIHLQGTDSNQDAIGARVLATVNDLTMERVVRAGSSYASQSEKTQTFGLGQSREVTLLEVHWPSGYVDRFENVAANQELMLIEGSSELLRIDQ